MDDKNSMEPTYGNAVLFLLVKTVVFSVLIAFIDKSYISYVTDPHRDGGLLQNTIGYTGYILIFGIIPSIIFFSVPIYAALLIKRPLLFIATILIIFVLDYWFYSKMDGFANNLERFYYWTCNLICFIILFYRIIKSKFSRMLK